MSSIEIANALGMRAVEFDLGDIPADAKWVWGHGMEGLKHSEETKQLMSEMRKGKRPAGYEKIKAKLIERNKGPYSKETRSKMSESAKKRIAIYNPTAGVGHTQEAKMKMRASHANRPKRPQTPETKEKIRQAALKRWENARGN